MAGYTQAQFEAALDALEPRIAAAFRAILGEITSRTQMTALQEAIAAGDVEGAIRVLQLDARIWGRLDAEIADAFVAGGLFQVDALPKFDPNGFALFAAFNARRPRAEQWVREASSRLIAEVTDETKQAVRETIEAGLAERKGAFVIARRIVGSRSKNGRDGGVLGLHSQYRSFVENARSELADPDRISDYLARKRRDRRFDSIAKTAMREGRGVNAKDVEAMARAYAERLTTLRGQTIARTEAVRAFNAGRFEAIAQNIEDGLYPIGAVKLEWRSTQDRRTRDTHRAMNGTKIQLGGVFVFPDGSRLRYPADISLGASAAETINCRCSDIVRIDWSQAF